MAKKKKHNRKKSTYKARSKQQAVSTGEAVATSTGDALESVTPAATYTQSPKKQSDDNTQVVARRARREVRHSLLLAVVILAGLIGLWCLFTFTSIGSQVFKLFDL
jgi:hypothetical protein